MAEKSRFEMMTFRVPAGMREAVARAAEREFTTPSAYIRAAVLNHMIATEQRLGRRSGSGRAA